MQGDIIGCLLHMPEGGRAFEKEKSVSSACKFCHLPQHVPCTNLHPWTPTPLPLLSKTRLPPKARVPLLHHAHILVRLGTVQCI